MNPRIDPKVWLGILLGAALILFSIRITGPDDLEDNSQSRNVGYAIDLVDHGHWLVQRDLENRIQSKPPLHTWMIGLLGVPFGLNRLTLTLPSFVAVVGMMLLVFHIGRKRFGLAAGIWAGLAMILCPLMWRQMGMVRSDAIFSLAIAGGAWGAFRAWETGRGWTIFWLCAAVSVLTKGPLGIVLSAIGLLAWFWEKRPSKRHRCASGGHTMGLLFFLLICLAWIVPALCFHGQDLVDQMIHKELLGHAVVPNNTRGNLAMRYLGPTVNFITRFAPFSLFVIAAIFRTFRMPAEDAGERRLERFLVCWILAGIVIFTLPAHHRADLLLPLWPAGALLSGLQLSRIGTRIGERRMAVFASVCGAALVVSSWLKYHPLPGHELKSAAYSQQVRAAAMAFLKTGEDPRKIRNLGLPSTFQYYVSTSEKVVTPVEVLGGLEKGGSTLLGTDGRVLDEAAFSGFGIEQIFSWPSAESEKSVVKIYEIRRL